MAGTSQKNDIVKKPQRPIESQKCKLFLLLKRNWKLVAGGLSRKEASTAWSSITTALNSMGPNKSVLEWRRTWRGYKCTALTDRLQCRKNEKLIPKTSQEALRVLKYAKQQKRRGVKVLMERKMCAKEGNEK